MPQKVTTLNSHQCCALDLPCCKPPAGMTREEAQIQSVTNKMVEWFTAASFATPPPEVQQYMHVAVSSLLSHVDLVPKGVGAAIVAGYSPFLVKTDPHASVKGADNGKTST